MPYGPHKAAARLCFQSLSGSNGHWRMPAGVAGDLTCGIADKCASMILCWRSASATFARATRQPPPVVHHLPRDSPMMGQLRPLALLCLIIIAVTGYPSGAMAAAADSNVTLRQLQRGVWLHTSGHTFANGAHYISNGLVVREGRQLVLVDTAWGKAATRQLLALIHRQIGLPVKLAIITHFHDDRISGTPVLEKAGITVLATPLTKRLAAANGNAVPLGTLKGLASPGSHIKVDGIEVFYPGAAHSKDNLMLWLPRQHLLYGGCAVRGSNWKSLGNLNDADITAWPAAIRRAANSFPDIRTVVPGHGPVGDAGLLAHTLTLLKAAP